MRTYWIILVLSLLVVACGPKGNVYIDNGGEEPLTVTIDQTPFSLQPGQRTLVEVEPGAHAISVKGEDGKVQRDTTVQIVQGGLINAAAAEFLVWKEVFAPQSTLELRKQLLKPGKLKINNFVYDVEHSYLPQSQLYVEQSWDLGLTEDFPKKVRGWDLETDEQYMFKTKLVRKSDFAEVYMKAAKP